MTDTTSQVPSSGPGLNVRLGETLRRCRRLRGVTLDVLAERTGLSKGFLSQVENGRREASLSTLEAITEALSVPLGVVMLLASGPGDAPELDERALASLKRKIESLLDDR